MSDEVQLDVIAGEIVRQCPEQIAAELYALLRSVSDDLEEIEELAIRRPVADLAHELDQAMYERASR